MGPLEILGLFLTISVLLYLFIGDNPLFRIVSYLFVGVASGYVFVLLLFQVLGPRLAQIVQFDDLTIFAIGIIPFLLGALLFFKLWPRTSVIGSVPMAILVGVGAAVTVGGAVFGTLFGQIQNTFALFPSIGQVAGNVVDQGTLLLEGLFVLFGTIATLAYFQFGARARGTAAEAALGSSGTGVTPATARRGAAVEVLALAGQIFIGITLGAVFAGVYSAAITALIERINFIFNAFGAFF
jgi:hypothetical protein